MRKVTVRYLYENIFDKADYKGVILDDSKVFVADSEGVGIYTYQKTEDLDTVIVNLDADDENYLAGKEELLIDMIGA